MRLDEDLTTLIQELNRLGCVSVEIFDDAQLKKRAAADEELYLSLLTDRERELRAELHGGNELSEEVQVETELVAVCDEEILGPCLALFGHYMATRTRAEGERVISELASGDYIVPNGYQAHLRVDDWFDADSSFEDPEDLRSGLAFMEDLEERKPATFNVTLRTSTTSGKPSRRRDIHDSSATGWSRFKAWWND